MTLPDFIPDGKPDGKIEYVRHFLYFPTKALAAAASGMLGMRTRKLETRYNNYSAQWLVLICDIYEGESAFEKERLSLLEVAESFQGEYDGWEFEIRNAIH